MRWEESTTRWTVVLTCLVGCRQNNTGRLLNTKAFIHSYLALAPSVGRRGTKTVTQPLCLFWSRYLISLFWSLYNLTGFGSAIEWFVIPFKILQRLYCLQIHGPVICRQYSDTICQLLLESQCYMCELTILPLKKKYEKTHSLKSHITLLQLSKSSRTIYVSF